MLRLKRITNTTSFLPEIDALRFVAIMPVFLLHLGTYLIEHSGASYDQEELNGNLLYNSRSFFQIGVPLFYAISGFILSLPFINVNKPAPKYKKYVVRRLTRLEPPYLLCMIACFLGHILFFGADMYDYLAHLAASLTYTHNIVYGHWSAINPVAWTLEIEVQFYLIAPFLVSMLNKLQQNARYITISLSIGAFIAIETYGSSYLSAFHLDRTILTKLHYFLIGILLCYFHRERPWNTRPKSFFWDIVALLALPLINLHYWIPVHPLLDKTAFVLSISLIIVSSFCGIVANKVARNPIIFTWGGMCYSIYLFHYILIHLFGKFTSQLHQSGVFTIDFIFHLGTTGVATMLACTIYYIFLERPCMDPQWPKKLKNALGLSYNKAETEPG